MRPILAPPAPPGLGRGPAPSFSTITAAYQAAATIVETIESALAQTVSPLEVIVVDDGSTDGTEEVLVPYRDRIVYLRQENGGAAAALNAGARCAGGDFVAILDADDVYEPERIEALTELAAERPDLDVLMTDAAFEIDGVVTSRFCDATPFAVDNQRLAIIERCFVAWPAVRREALLAVGGFEESLRIAYDWYCWLRLLHAGSSAGLVAEALMRYRVGEQSLTANRVAALRERVAVLELASRLDLSPDERRQLERFLAPRRRRAVLAEAEQALRRHEPDARRRSLAVALAAGMPVKTRLKGVASAIAPSAAARRLAELEARTGHTRIRRGKSVGGRS